MKNMNDKRLIWISKALSYLLRHGAFKESIFIDKNGWVQIRDVVEFLNMKAIPKITMEDISYVVERNNKQRFSMSEGKIRANQGHSFNIDLNLLPLKPPDVLYHGSHLKAKIAIEKEGIKKMNRNHVHLSKDIATAINVGKRRGKPIVFEIDSRKMHEDGFQFYCSENGVWLVEFVPKRFFKNINMMV